MPRVLKRGPRSKHCDCTTSSTCYDCTLSAQPAAIAIHSRPFVRFKQKMSAADFLLAPEVQKLLQVVFSEPRKQFSVDALAKKTKLEAADICRTQEHLIKSGILTRLAADDGATEAVSANTAFIFYTELRSIALKSFAAAEPIRAMLRSKFKHSVVNAFVLGEDNDATVELLVVHGQLVPDKSDMAAACRKLSTSTGRHLKVHVISLAKHASLKPQDCLGAKLASPCAFEIVSRGDTKAKLPGERQGFLKSAKNTLAALTW